MEGGEPRNPGTRARRARAPARQADTREISISLSEEDVLRLDRRATETRTNRSAVVRQLIRDHVPRYAVRELPPGIKVSGDQDAGAA